MKSKFMVVSNDSLSNLLANRDIVIVGALGKEYKVEILCPLAPCSAEPVIKYRVPCYDTTLGITLLCTLGIWDVGPIVPSLDLRVISLLYSYRGKTIGPLHHVLANIRPIRSDRIIPVKLRLGHTTKQNRRSA